MRLPTLALAVFLSLPSAVHADPVQFIAITGGGLAFPSPGLMTLHGESFGLTGSVDLSDSAATVPCAAGCTGTVPLRWEFSDQVGAFHIKDVDYLATYTGMIVVGANLVLPAVIGPLFTVAQDIQFGAQVVYPVEVRPILSHGIITLTFTGANQAWHFQSAVLDFSQRHVPEATPMIPNPEPATWLLLGTGLIGAIRRRRLSA